MTPKEQIHEEWVGRCRWWAKRINELLDLNAPDCVVAHAVTSLFFVGVSYIGEDTMREFSRRLLEDGRRKIARCQDCDNPVPIHLTYNPSCGECEAKTTGDVFLMEMEYPEEEESE